MVFKEKPKRSTPFPDKQNTICYSSSITKPSQTILSKGYFNAATFSYTSLVGTIIFLHHDLLQLKAS
ncbi:hypothetical protein E4O04_12290 [Treponema sp. OMZ 799]|uniref:hypothetical protein n=1 Tax=Treponema sp. OMZ 799 TaxID=2563668 RepID=UPI0020A443BC|nr:hypothetical protein [Treponema sp. OMZ 799]UTC78729.1 hypothetical protein E4O04_12290 [Treponema sp. OMZ 799]